MRHRAGARPAARPAHGGARRAASDPGRFSLPTKFGLTLKGDIQNYVPVTDEMLRNPPDGDWLMFRRNYAGWSYSPLKEINTDNVAKLTLKWMWSMPENGTMEITPMVHNGIIYVWGTGNTIQALDAKTGNLLWENRIGPAPRAPGPGPSTEETRSLGFWGNYLFVNTPYGMVYALDARTGEEIWKNNIVDYKPGIGGSTGGVIVINGKVLVGMTNCGRPGTDDHCYISAYDAKTGKRDWKFVTVALKGQPGGDSWGTLPDNQRKGAETWIAGTYDPELNTTYWGTAQAKPWRRDLRGSGTGDTDYANSTLALDPDTGKLKWFFQHGPGESLDLDEVYERVLIDHGDQKTLMTIGKAGILWKLDRVTGKFIAAKETVFQNIWKSIDPKTGRPDYRKDIVDQKVDQWLSSCPGPEGGHDWQATSYHQPSDTLIIPLVAKLRLHAGQWLAGLFRDAGHGRQYGTAVGLSHRRHEAALVLPAAGALPDRRDLDRGQSGLCRRLRPRLPRGGRAQRQDPVEDPAGHHGAGLPGHLQRGRPSVYRRHHRPGRRQPGSQAQHHADAKCTGRRTAMPCSFSACRTRTDRPAVKNANSDRGAAPAAPLSF